MKNSNFIYGLAVSEPIVNNSKGYRELTWGFQFFEQMSNVWVVKNHNNNGLYRIYEGSVDNIILESSDFFTIVNKINDGFRPYSIVEQKKASGNWKF